jgi:hypothetical protein
VETGDVVDERGDNDWSVIDRKTAPPRRLPGTRRNSSGESLRKRVRFVIIVARRSKPFEERGLRETTESARIASEEARRAAATARMASEDARDESPQTLLGTPWSMPSARQLMR